MHKYLRQLFIVLSLSAITSIAFAAAPVVHVAPKPVWVSTCKPYNQKPAARTIDGGAYNELIEEQINVEAHQSYNHFITQITSAEGVQDNSELSVSFNPAYERLDFHEIIIWRDGKAQNRLNLAAFKMLADESEFDKFIYNGTYSAKFILPDVRKGDRIEYSYTITGANPIFAGHYCRSIYFQGYNVIAHQYTAMLVSAVRKMHFKYLNGTPKTLTTNLPGGLTRYEWETYQVKAQHNGDHQPAWYNAFQRVQVSDFNNWAEVAAWAMKINPLTTSFRGELAQAIAKLKKDAGGDTEKYFRSAVKLVQDEVRYMGIETGEYSHRANNPDKVFNQRYGDCKDKSLLLASILQAGGIEAHMALIGTGLKDKMDDFLPSSALFNHAVVVATVKGKSVWVDATIAYQRGTGTNIYFPPYMRGLVLDAATTGLTMIPATPTGKTYCTEVYTVKNEKDSADLTIKTHYTLNEADEQRDRLASSSTAETEKNYLDYYAKIYPSIEAKDSLTIIDDEARNELTTIEHYRIGHYLKLDTTDDKYHGDFYANLINEQLPKVNGQTRNPVAVNYPVDIDYTVKFIFPQPWDMAEKSNKIVRDSYEYYFDRTVNGDTVTHRYRLNYDKDFVPANQVPQLIADVKDLSDDRLSFGFYYTPPGHGDKPVTDTNPVIVMLGIFGLLGVIFAMVKLSERRIGSKPRIR